jgi:hypothetical protein
MGGGGVKTVVVVVVVVVLICWIHQQVTGGVSKRKGYSDQRLVLQCWFDGEEDDDDEGDGGGGGDVVVRAALDHPLEGMMAGCGPNQMNVKHCARFSGAMVR